MAKRGVGEGIPSLDVMRLVKMVRQEVETRLGPEATFEQRRAAAAAVMGEAAEFLINGIEDRPERDQSASSLPPVGDEPCTKRKSQE